MTQSAYRYRRWQRQQRRQGKQGRQPAYSSLFRHGTETLSAAVTAAVTAGEARTAQNQMMTDTDSPCASTVKNPTIIFLISPFLSTRDLVQLGQTCIVFGSAQETEDQQISLINRVADHLFLNEANYNEMRALPCNISQSYILRLHRLMSMRQFLQEVAPQRGAIHFHHTH